MIHQISVPLHRLTDAKFGDWQNAPFLQKRGIQIGDYLCFECNDANFPRSMKRWLYAEVTALKLMEMVRNGIRLDGYVDVHFRLVTRLSDVTLD
jgi:hypothetical protein